MLFTTTNTRVALLPLPLLILATLFAFATSANALPTSNRRAAALFEPLFHAADPQVGPSRSIERLRLRRSLASLLRREAPVVAESVIVKRNQPITNPKAKRSAIASSPVISNPKKRSVLTSSPVVVLNPKAKRSLVVNTPVVLNPKAKRSVAAPVVVLNPKKRSTIPSAPIVLNPKKRSLLKRTPIVVAATPLSVTAPSRRSVFLSLVRRILAGEKVDAQVERRAIGVPRVIPNPKNPAFVSSCTSTVTVQPLNTPRTTTTQAASTSSKASTTSKTTTTTTTTKAATTTSKTTTTVKPTTTTKAATTTTKATTTKTTTTIAATPTSSSWPASGGMIAGGYWADWTSETLPVSSIDFDMYDLINFSFIVPTSTHGVAFSDYNSADLLTELVAAAHAKNSKVLIAVGGWSDSAYFSDAVKNAANRATFVKAIAALVNKYNVDGVDIDWEYPGTAGADGNVYNTKVDTNNFLLFLQALRAALPTKRLSSCTTQHAFIGENGSPLTDVSAFAAVLDNILVMNYDVWGASANPGANAPLKNTCANSQQPNANMLSAIEAWEAAGMPAKKMLMGVPAYGYVSKSTATSLVHKRDGIPSIPVKPMSNRERATVAHKEELATRAEKYISPFHRSYNQARAAVESRRRERRALKRSQRTTLAASSDNALVKRAAVFCPDNHSGKPCAGVEGQNITEIKWNPLTDSRNSTGNSTSGGDGVFTGNVGKTKLGQGDLKGLEGNQINFWELVNYGVLVQDGHDFNPVNGYTRAWDDCSSTPYLYDVSRSAVITYDDPASMAKKGRLALQKGIAGIMMWEMSGDTTQGELAQSWRVNMGLTRSG